MPDTKGSMEDILILVIRYAEDQVSVENVEEFLKSKELQTELNKAFSDIAASVLKYGMTPDAEQKIEADAVSKLPAAVGSAYGDHAKAIWESKYKKPVKKEVAEIKENIDRSLRATLGPGIYILKGAVYVVVSLAAAAVVYKRHMILSKAQEVCRPENQLLCTAVTKLAVLDYAKTREIGSIKLDGSGKLSFSPSFTEMKTEFVGNIAVPPRQAHAQERSRVRRQQSRRKAQDLGFGRAVHPTARQGLDGRRQSSTTRPTPRRATSSI